MSHYQLHTSEFFEVKNNKTFQDTFHFIKALKFFATTVWKQLFNASPNFQTHTLLYFFLFFISPPLEKISITKGSYSLLAIFIFYIVISVSEVKCNQNLCSNSDRRAFYAQWSFSCLLYLVGTQWVRIGICRISDRKIIPRILSSSFTTSNKWTSAFMILSKILSCLSSLLHFTRPSK